MKHFLLATALLAACATASAQQGAEVPKYKCEPIPQMPGRALMTDKMVKRNFDNDLKTYKECINGYIDQRRAVIKANEDAANSAINDYNGVMKALNEASGASSSGDASKTDSGYRR